LRGARFEVVEGLKDQTEVVGYTTDDERIGRQAIVDCIEHTKMKNTYQYCEVMRSEREDFVKRF